MKKLSILVLTFALAITLHDCSGNSRNSNYNNDITSAATSSSSADASTSQSANIDSIPDSSQNNSSYDKTDVPADSAVQDSAVKNSQINVYNSGGYLINAISAEKYLNALSNMLTDAPIYSGPDLHLTHAPYRLEVQSNSSESYDLWLRNNRIYFKASGSDIIYAPENMNVSEFKQIINRK